MPIDTPILELIDELHELRTKRDDHWQIPREEGEVLFQIARTSNAKKILELGTSYGFSGLFWAAALQQTGGTLHTIDIDPRKYDSSRQTFRRAGLSEVVVNHLGDAAEIAPSIPGPIDIAFIDASGKKETRRYFDLIWPNIRIGGSVLVDNATTHRAELADFVAHVRSRPDAASTELPVGNGLEWAVKLR
ncbi:MAG TPA: class I SAM-dependent methyltransferase [Tepidisphaeraceae bacterium]|nr:class I SAM-dependent methyltransferase [Tepidisphaeraceae bacterium]